MTPRRSSATPIDSLKPTRAPSTSHAGLDSTATASQRLEALLRGLAERLDRLGETPDDAVAAETFCTIQASVDSWLAGFENSDSASHEIRNLSAEPDPRLPAIEQLITQLGKFTQEGQIVIMETELSALLIRCQSVFEGAAQQNCHRASSEPACRAVRKARLSGRRIDCLDCGLAPEAGSSERNGKPRLAQRSLDNSNWSASCAAYPETISRALGPNQRGAWLNPTNMAEWEQRGLLSACNADSIKSGRDALRSARKMYLIQDVLRLREQQESKLYSI